MKLVLQRFLIVCHSSRPRLANLGACLTDRADARLEVGRYNGWAELAFLRGLFFWAEHSGGDSSDHAARDHAHCFGADPIFEAGDD
jgi:hypothetical protein